MATKKAAAQTPGIPVAKMTKLQLVRMMAEKLDTEPKQI